MVKGFVKQVVVIRGGSDLFEEAIFVLKPKKIYSKKMLAAEAERIIKEKTSSELRKRKNSFIKLMDQY